MKILDKFLLSRKKALNPEQSWPMTGNRAQQQRKNRHLHQYTPRQAEKKDVDAFLPSPRR